LLGGPLGRPIGQAVPPVTEVRKAQAHRWLAREEVIREGEVLKVRQFTDTWGDFAGQQVVCHVELFNAHQFIEHVRQWAQQLVETQIEDGQILEQTNLRRQAGSEPIVHHDNLVEVGHVAEAGRDAAVELVVG
jgi:hypothetical protein